MIYLYDGTFEGLISVIFESYSRKQMPEGIVVEEEYQAGFFDQSICVESNKAQAERVLKKVEEIGTKESCRLIYRCFLSELKGIEMHIFHFVKTLLEQKENVLQNYLDEKILRLHQINKQIGREVHRMHAFVRFQETRDGLFVSLIEPDFNVLPLIGKHFEERYPAMEWLIYDQQRCYGLFYNKQKSRFITFTEAQHKQLTEELITHAETDYQQLWKSYFKAVDIPERKNMKLHLQHVPRRYWKYLVEKI